MLGNESKSKWDYSVFLQVHLNETAATYIVFCVFKT